MPRSIHLSPSEPVETSGDSDYTAVQIVVTEFNAAMPLLAAPTARRFVPCVGPANDNTLVYNPLVPLPLATNGSVVHTAVNIGASHLVHSVDSVLTPSLSGTSVFASVNNVVDNQAAHAESVDRPVVRPFSSC